MERFIIYDGKKILISEETYNHLQDFNKRKTYFESGLKKFKINKVCCASCAFPTISEQKSFEICPICNWEENGYSDDDLLTPNHSMDEPLTLLDYRLNFSEKISAHGDVFDSFAYFKIAINTIKIYEKKYAVLVEDLYGKTPTQSLENIRENINKLNYELLTNLNIKSRI